MTNSKCTDFVAETDCLQLVQLIRTSYCTYSYLGRVIKECNDLLLGMKDQNSKLIFVKRSLNVVAYCLARYSNSIADRAWRVENVYPNFQYVLCKDLLQ